MLAGWDILSLLCKMQDIQFLIHSYTCRVVEMSLIKVFAFLQQVELLVHYENNTPFLTVTRMTRVIELSHWGNIAIEETYDLVHSGAVLKGPFSRYDYQRSQDGVSSVKSFRVSYNVCPDIEKKNDWSCSSVGSLFYLLFTN